ncbi:HNH endonuclease [Hoeflea sp.]|uniref:HNH endonuclease n=1 Tax=Hoeflea sp. TaxID=1940281 RepID=UPI00374919C3
MTVEYRSARLTESALNPKVLRITVTPFLDALPEDAVGGSTRNDIARQPLTLRWREMSVQVDLPTDKRTGRPRGFIRHRGEFTKTFFRESRAEVGDTVIFERLGTHEFRLHLEKPDGLRFSGAATSSNRKEKIRNWAMRETRPEQQEFRRKIAERDGLRCAISHCEVAEILDAAHLWPRADGGLDAPQNGIILRADLHRLFDADLLKLDCGGRKTISKAITDQDYNRFHDVIAQSGADFGLLTARAARRTS